MTLQESPSPARSSAELNIVFKRGAGWKPCTQCGRGHNAPFKQCRQCRVGHAVALATWRAGQTKQKLCWYCVEPQAKAERNAWHPVVAQRGRYTVCERHRQYKAAYDIRRYWQRLGTILEPERQALAQDAIARWEAVRVGKARKPAGRRAA